MTGLELLRGIISGAVETKVSMTRPVTAESGPLLATGTVVHRAGRRQAFASWLAIAAISSMPPSTTND